MSDKIKYLCLGKNKIDKSMFKKIKNADRYVPDGGIWGSTYKENDRYKSRWHKFCSKEFTEMNSNHGVIFSLAEESKGYIIDSLDDLLRLHDRFHYIWRDRELLDFESISKEYDYIILTEKGEEETRSPLYSLYAWDSECIIVFNFDCIEIGEYVEW